MTAEFAVLLPAIIGLVVVLISAAAQQTAIGAAGRTLGTLGRAVELGKSGAAIKSLARQMGLKASLLQEGDLLCIRADVPIQVLGIPTSSQRMQSCGLPPGS